MVDWLYDPDDVSLGDLGDVDASDTTVGHVPTRQADGTFAMEPGSGGGGGGGKLTVDAGSPNSDGDLVFRYGIDATDTPYFDDSGVASGEEAVVTLDSTDGVLYIEKVSQ